MADRPHRGLWAVVAGSLAACLVACLVGCTTIATGSSAVGPPPESTTTPPGSTTPPAGGPAGVRVLQLNLCSSGIASCYTGRSTTEAAAVIRTEKPDLVTLNEVCQDDVATLQQALSDVVPGGAVASAFQAARNGRTGDPYRCRNGEQYGIGIVSRWPSVPGSSAGGGIYPAQDADDPEERAWLCLDVAGPRERSDGAVAVCTTHLAYTKSEVAVAQCRYLFGTVITELRARDGAAPLVLGGDLNLGSGDSPDLRSCLPTSSAVVGDGGVQHVVATPEFVVGSSRTIDMRGATDHPGLLVTLTTTPA